ncbi:hypothetical protein DPMN_024613 [Dreissena polymorpha]|uniref:Uncharacterized protein n=1 Tax=Dreissena polymorpha TaxID=45954 RepID=A0A9D4LPP2_DREPO|nr:hypothetical protein DPMN_024613 [Dreissena polymorpha]
MVIVRRWIEVYLHHRKRDGISGGGSVEDERLGPWADIHVIISRGLPYEDDGSFPRRRYSVRSTCWGNRSGVQVDGLWCLERP